MSLVFKFFKKQVDAIIYGLIGPFSVLYMFPHFCLEIENSIGINIPTITILKYLGIVLMNLGLILALWSAGQMYISKKANPNPFSFPHKLIKSGLFSVVRHPMMWALNFVLIGQIFVYNSPLILVWFLIWWRFSLIYIARYEEPYLLSIFGKEYIDYCRTTPRWIPDIFRNNKRK